MAEDTVLAAPDEGERGIIAQTNQERALLRIRKFQETNQTAAEREEAEDLQKQFAESFVKLCRVDFGIRPEQLGEFPKPELETLPEALVKRGTWRRLCYTALGAVSCVPSAGFFTLAAYGRTEADVVIPAILGGLCLIMPFITWNFIANSATFKLHRTYRKLLKRGDDYFPHERLQKLLAPPEPEKKQ